MFSSNASQVSNDVNYIESVFQTHLYTGNGATQTITNGIDLAGKGGLVWFKPRNTANNHNLIDNSRGLNKFLITNSTAADGTTGAGYGVSSFNSDGFSLAPPWTSSTNTTSTTQVAWTFREQPKFFDVVTWTSNGTNQTISHNLGSTPGMIIVKATSTTDNWWVYHRSVANALQLNTTSAQLAYTAITGVTGTTFNALDNGLAVNGATYVAYLFAHDAGGFGLSGNENVVSCGTYTGNGSATGPVVTLGYEPQWVMIKRSSAAGNWVMLDVMRGFSDSSDNELYADLALEEGAGLNLVTPLATGFQLQSSTGNINGSGSTYIYIAIRRGPMKVPTLGTTVFAPVSTSGNPSSLTAGFPVDFALGKEVKNSTGYGNYAIDRLRGGGALSETNTTGAEYTGQTFKFDSNTQFLQSGGGLFYGPSIYWNFRRAPSFFDEVCYTGTGNPLTLNHNLGVAPELILYKSRSNAQYWLAQSSVLASVTDSYLLPNYDSAAGNIGGLWRTPSATTFGIALSGNVTGANVSSQTYVAYLFATCAGVSKVGSYTGTGTTQAINCGFAAGARFVMIKRTDDVGDWYVWDSARGIVANSDPYLLLNTTAAETTGTDYIDPSSAGFEISSTAPAAINASGGSYIFLAVA